MMLIPFVDDQKAIGNHFSLRYNNLVRPFRF